MNTRALLLLGSVVLGWAVRAEEPPAAPAAPANVAANPAAPITVRTGPHAGFGRIVFDVGPAVAYKIVRNADTLIVRFPEATLFAEPQPPPNNVRAIRVVPGQAEITVAPGARLREMRVNGRVVLDILDPAVPPRPAPAAAPASAEASPPPAKAEPAKATPPKTESAQAAPPPPREAPPPEELAFTIPINNKAGAAVFTRGNTTYAVFDERWTLDLGALRDAPAFAETNVSELPNGTVIAMHPPKGMTVALTPGKRGWKIAFQDAKPDYRPIALNASANQLSMMVDAPGHVIALAEPDTGATLLVGTVRNNAQGVESGLQTPEFALPPTLRGVVVEPLSEAVGLRPTGTGFLLTGATDGLVITLPGKETNAISATRHLTRRINLPNFSPEALLSRIAIDVAAAGAAPQGARGPKRRGAAATMLALGLAAEAEALLTVAAEQDPREAASPETICLTAIAAMLAGRLDEASRINDPLLGDSDELAFWRAMLKVLRNEANTAEPAAVFAVTGPLALLYPQGIRDRVLPVVLESLILGGETAAARRLLAMAKDAPGTGYARALLTQADGDPAAALAALDALAAGTNQRDHARAAARAIELRLASGQLDPAAAAAAMDKLRYAWRGDRREPALRERVADLLQRAGAWRAALAELRATEADFPEQAKTTHAHLMAMFSSILDGDASATLPPLDLIALVDENSDLLATATNAPALEEQVADRLLALDLPERAAPILERLAANTASGATRAGIGARLAGVRLQEGDPAGALLALTATESDGMNPVLTQLRGFLASAAHVRLGDTPAAIADLAGLSGPAAEMTRATAYEQAGDWGAAQTALARAVAASLPESGPLDDSQSQLVLRLAAAATRSGDSLALADLRGRYVDRIGAGPLADMLRLLLQEPVKTGTDLQRAGREAALASNLAAGLAAIEPRQ